MHIIHKLSKALIILTALFSFALSAAPENFYQAKIDYKRHVYFDRTDEGTIYCGCNWRWKGRSGGVVDLKSCGYEGNSMHNRAKRIEAEHIYPASHMGSQRQCWQNGGRKNCNKTDPVFNAMEADLHNLAPSVGAINARRSNYNFGQLPQIENQFGACDFKVDASTRIAEPRDKVKGMVARVSFYMVDRYDLSMSKQQQQLFIAWNKMYPVTPWEKERDRRIKKVMGHSNPFVTGESHWKLGHKNSAVGVVSEIPSSHPAFSGTKQSKNKEQKKDINGAIHGNRNSKIYHLPTGCPSYNAMSSRNKVLFSSEREAKKAGFRKARNCR